MNFFCSATNDLFITLLLFCACRSKFSWHDIKPGLILWMLSRVVLTHLQVAVCLTVWMYVCVNTVCDTLRVKMHWDCAIVHLCTLCVCAWALIAYAEVQRLCGWQFSSCVTILSCWMLRVSWEGSMPATKGCPTDSSVLRHTPTSHTISLAAGSLRLCHSSPERLPSLVLLPLLIVARAEHRDQYVDYRGS